MEGDEQRREAGRGQTRSRVPDAEIAELRDVRFSTGMRGYDRDEVDRYLHRVNQVIAELQITAAPESAIRHALERAHETADEITRRSRSQADDRVQRAEREAQQLEEAAEQETRQLRTDAGQEAREVREAAARESREVREAAQSEAGRIREAAEVRVRELEADAHGILEERARLISELRDLIRRLGDVAEGAASRQSGQPAPSVPDEEA